MQTNITTQIKILTGVMALGSLAVGLLLAYVKMSMGSALAKTESKISADIVLAQKSMMLEIKQEFARKELIDSRLAEFDRRVNKIEARQEARQEVRITSPPESHA